MKYYLFLLSFLTACNTPELENKTREKQVILQAESIMSYGQGGTSFKIFIDSSYLFEVNFKGFNYEKYEKFTGHLFIKDDTISFFPSRFGFNNSEEAVVKNGFIEFVDSKSSFRLGIAKSSLPLRSKLDFKNFDDYAVFTYSSAFDNYFSDNSKPYDLTQTELIQIDDVLKTCLKENQEAIKKDISKYVKQCIVFLNAKGEKEALIFCHCKDIRTDGAFRYSFLGLGNDGGDCRFRVKINLTKDTYSELFINGEA
jgi:hypothetical protein